MSSRDEITDFITANWSATPVVLLDDYVSLGDLPPSGDQVLVGLDFPSAAEELASIAVHENNGWREFGQVQLMVFNPIGYDSSIARGHGEDLRALLRGKRIGQTVIGGVNSFSALGQSDGKWQVYVSLANFYRDAFQ